MPNKTSLNPNRLLVIQPYIPAYRVPLFKALKVKLAELGIELAVAAAPASGKDHSRNDDTTTATADFVLKERHMRIGHRSLRLRQLGPVLSSFRPQFVIVEQAIKNVESWPIIMNQGRPSRPAVAMWGHGRTYSTDQSPMQAWSKNWLTLRADWFFSYTELGADFVVAQGFPRGRVTVLNNSTDSRTLSNDIANISEIEIDAFRAKYGLKKGFTALFLGGVDSRKGIAFLLEASREVSRNLSGFTLLVGGSGELAADVLKEQEIGDSVRYLGRVEGHAKAVALAAADLIMVPEWVGLIAVDALVSGKPIVTTHHSSHSAEIEYLTDGKTAVFTEHTVSAYSAGVSSLLRDQKRMRDMRERCIAMSHLFSLEDMSKRFIGGIKEWRSSKSD